MTVDNRSALRSGQGTSSIHSEKKCGGCIGIARSTQEEEGKDEQYSITYYQEDQGQEQQQHDEPQEVYTYD